MYRAIPAEQVEADQDAGQDASGRAAKNHEEQEHPDVQVELRRIDPHVSSVRAA
jgi:hypothetical protein